MRNTLAVLLLCALALFLPHPASASLTSVYVAQTASGSANGTSCANAQNVSFFNSASNWGSGAAQIGPGTTVHLCGTISSAITAQASGTAAAPITILFDPGAKISMPDLPDSGALIAANLSYITIDGGSTVACGYIVTSTSATAVTCNNGAIEATSNGTGLATQDGGSDAILVDGSDHIEIRNLLIANVYVHSGMTDTADVRTWCIHAYGTTNMNVHNNTMHDVEWCIDGGGQGMLLENNEIYNVSHGLGMGGPITSGSAIHIEHNYIHDFAVWDTNADAYHHDGIHIFTDNGSITVPIYVNANLIGGDQGSNLTSPIYMEADNSPLNNYVMSNNMTYFVSDRLSNQGAIALYTDGSTGANNIAVNNTVFGPGYAPNGCCTGVEMYVAQGQTNARFQNNVGDSFGGNNSANIMGLDSGVTFVSGGLSNNAYLANGSNTFSWGGNQFPDFSTWVSDTGEKNSQNPTNAQMNLNATTGAPGAGSVLCGQGINLTSLDIPEVSADFYGNPRSATGAWDEGAISCASGSSATAPPPAPPTNVVATVH